MPIQLGSPQKTIHVDISSNENHIQANRGSPNVNIIKNLILSPSELNNKFASSNFKTKESLKRNVFSPDFLVIGNDSAGKENRSRLNVSPTPLKAFLNDHMERLKKCREAACMVDLNKKYCLTGGKPSRQSSLANSNNQSSNNIGQGDGNPTKSWLKELMNTKHPLQSSVSLKRSLDKLELSKGKKASTPSAAHPHDEFSRQFFEKPSKIYRSSVEMPSESLGFKLGSIMHDKELFKRRNCPQPDKEELTHAREIYETFKTRLIKNKTSVAKK